MDAETLNLIGGGGGVSEYVWQMQLRSAPAHSGRVFHHGTEICLKPPFQHCAAEGICR